MALLVLVALAPLWRRAATQGLEVGALVTAAAAVAEALAVRSQDRWFRLAVPVVAVGVGAVTMRPVLGAFAGVACLAAFVVTEGRRSVASVIAVAGLAVAYGLLLAADAVALPTAIALAGVAVGFGLGRARPGPGLEEPSRRLLTSAAAPWVIGWALSIHRPTAGGVVAGVAAALAAVALAGAKPATTVLRGIDTVVEGIRRVTTVVVLLPFYVVVVVPLGFVMRLLGRRPLDVGLRRDGRSYWLAPRDRPARPLTQQFSDERRWRPVDPDRGGAALVVRTVVAVLVVQALIVGGVALYRDRTKPEPTFAGASDAGSAGSAALAGLPWADEALRETGEASSGLVYTPYVGWSLRDYSGRYVNIANRVRASYEPETVAGADPFDVWFFGGSTMFGFDLQRDDHTIPSEVARLAEAAGRPLRVRNYGSPGYVSYQEASLLSLLLTAGEKPDLVVFYDGVNDMSLELLDVFAGVNPSGEPADHYAQVLRAGFADSALVPGMTGERPSPLVAERPAGPPTRASVAGDIADVFHQAVELSGALSDRYDVPVLHFWQPDAFSKARLDPGERERIEELGITGRTLDTLSALSRTVRTKVRTDAVDLGDALDGLDGPVLTDTVHVNERGATAIAEAMWPTIRAALQET